MTDGGNVSDSEILYRRARGDTLTLRGGNWVCSVTAFTDPNREPSVDRAELTGFDPEWTRLEDSDGVLELHTGEVREIRVARKNHKGRVVCEHDIDVIADPTNDNRAHAKVIGRPALTSGPFRRLREELAERAVVLLAPRTAS